MTDYVGINRHDLMGGDIREAMDRVIEHGQFINGPEVGRLEVALAEYVGVKHCIACSSGTDALLMALMAYGVGRGDAVFTTPFTFVATAEVIALLGATPVFVDIDPYTYNLDAKQLAAAIAKVRKEGVLNPRGVIPVDLFGLPADYAAIIDVDSHGFVIEDAAQAFGASYHNERAGRLGHTGCTSFFPTKPLGCYGDGGAIFTNEDSRDDVLRLIRQHGGKERSARLGINGRLDTIQAAVLLAKLPHLERELEQRRRVASLYSAALAGRYVVPVEPPGYQSAWAQYSILSWDREADYAKLRQAEIPASFHYLVPLHRQPAFSYLGYRIGDFPVAERVASQILQLPMHPYLTDEQVSRVIEVLLA